MQERMVEIFRLVEKINESGESLPFPGINPEAYSRKKADDEEFPGYTTPIDEIIERCKKRGYKSSPRKASRVLQCIRFASTQ